MTHPIQGSRGALSVVMMMSDNENDGCQQPYQGMNRFLTLRGVPLYNRLRDAINGRENSTLSPFVAGDKSLPLRRAVRVVAHSVVVCLQPCSEHTKHTKRRGGVPDE